MLKLTIDWREVKINFMEEELTVVLRPLTTPAFNILLPHFSELSISKEEASIEVVSKLADIQKLSAEILPTHMKELRGIEINGKEPTAKQISEEVSLASLAVSILSEMMALTQPDMESEKNLSSLPVEGPLAAMKVVE